MSKSILDLLPIIDQEISQQNKARDLDSVKKIGHLTIELLGQHALLVNPEINNKLILFATVDVDAHLKGDVSSETIFKKVLKENNYFYDELSKEIWIPKEAHKIKTYNSENVTAYYYDPISVLTSKAIKSPVKNKNLIKQAIKIYGKTLIDSIINNGGDISKYEN